MARKAAAPPPVRRGRRPKGLADWEQTSKSEWHAASTTEGETGARVRMMNGRWRGAGTTYLAYRGGLYLGHEETLEAAQVLAESGARRASATPAEHAELAQAEPVPETEEEKKARETRASMRADRRVGKRKAEIQLDRDLTIRLLVGENPRRAGTGKHARFARLMEFDGKRVGAYLDAGGNPETLANAATQKLAAME